MGGSFGNESAEYIDGQPVNIGYINLPILIPDQDAISEFKVQYNNLGPEWGKFSGGIVNLSTKGGSNQYHGEAYEYLRNKVLNARPIFRDLESSVRAEPVRRHFGGPVIKDKTFFFFAYDGYRQRASTTTTTVLTDAERTGNFADICKTGFTGPGGICADTDPTTGAFIDQIYDPWGQHRRRGNLHCCASAANCGRTQFARQLITSPVN